jgi:ATP-dependent protease HslVU (ClpYQ) peptidase subunit
MTVLVGIQGADFTVLAADSQITDGDQRIISIQTPKIVQVNEYLLGVTGESRPGDILTYQWNPPKYRGEHPVDFMGAKVIPSMYKVFKENGYELPLNDKETTFQYLLSFNAFLFSVGDDLSFNCMERGLFAIGSGGNYALGYLYSLRQKNFRSRLLSTAAAEKAVELACVLDINCCPPVQSVTQERKVK